MNDRKVGQAMNTESLQSISPDALINRVTMFIRTDFGGELKERVALGRALDYIPEFGSILAKLSADEQKVLGGAIVSVAVHAAEGSRKRVQTTVDEMRRRWGEPKAPKTDSTLIKI